MGTNLKMVDSFENEAKILLEICRNGKWDTISERGVSGTPSWTESLGKRYGNQSLDSSKEDCTCRRVNSTSSFQISQNAEERGLFVRVQSKP